MLRKPKLLSTESQLRESLRSPMLALRFIMITAYGVTTTANRFLKRPSSPVAPRARPVRIPDLGAVADLDRYPMEDVSVSPEAVAMASPLKAVRWGAGTIDSGHPTRWSLSGDWDRAS